MRKFDLSASGMFAELDVKLWKRFHDMVHHWATNWIISHMSADLLVPPAIRFAAICISKHIGATMPPDYLLKITQVRGGEWSYEADQDAVDNLIRIGFMFGYALAQETFDEETHIPDLGFPAAKEGHSGRKDAPGSGDSDDD